MKTQKVVKSKSKKKIAKSSNKPKTREVVINNCFGGFSLSPEATLRLYELGAKIDITPVEEYWKADRDPESICGYARNLREWREYLANPEEGKRKGIFVSVISPDEKYVLCARDIKRDDPLLIQVIEEMGEKANGACAELKIVEIPADAAWQIDEYDGSETVREPSRSWG